MKKEKSAACVCGRISLFYAYISRGEKFLDSAYYMMYSINRNNIIYHIILIQK